MIAGLGAGKAQRYIASDLDWLSDRLFDARVIAVVLHEKTGTGSTN
jgi:hypothetical protein